MSNPSPYPPTFSPRRKWAIAFNAMIATIAVFLILVGVNYLSTQYFSKRFYLNSDPRIRLSDRTVNLLRSLTNQVTVIVYYDKGETTYPDIISLLREYQSYDRNLVVKTVDYYNNPGAAQALKNKYDLGSATNKNFIIFDCDGRKAFVDGARLSTFTYDLQPSTNQDDSKIYLNRRRIAFNGEMLFTANLFAITQAKPLKAYFLQGDGERSPNETNDSGYSKLADVFYRNNVQTDTLKLLNTNSVPLDCNLLVIAGPTQPFDTNNETEKISEYLDQGGRLLVLFDAKSYDRDLGLESILAKWNVRVGDAIVRDPIGAIAHSDGNAIAVSTFMETHDVMKPLIGSELELVLPRPVGFIKAPSQAATDEPQVTDLAFSSTNSTLSGDPSADPRRYPLMVAVEKGAPKGIVTERGTTRMIIVGDSFFLDNQVIPAAGNEDFADSAINWLLERTIFANGIGPRAVTEYRLIATAHQIAAVKGILLGAIPGGILLFGGLVWLRRRK